MSAGHLFLKPSIGDQKKQGSSEDSKASIDQENSNNSRMSATLQPVNETSKRKTNKGRRGSNGENMSTDHLFLKPSIGDQKKQGSSEDSKASIDQENSNNSRMSATLQPVNETGESMSTDHLFLKPSIGDQKKQGSSEDSKASIDQENSNNSRMSATLQPVNETSKRKTNKGRRGSNGEKISTGHLFLKPSIGDQKKQGSSEDSKACIVQENSNNSRMSATLQPVNETSKRKTNKG